MTYRPNFGTSVSDLPDITAAGLGGPALTDIEPLNRSGVDYRASMLARQALFRRSPAGSRTAALLSGAATATLTATDNDKVVVLTGGVAGTLTADATLGDGFVCVVRNRTGAPLGFSAITLLGGAATLPDGAACLVSLSASRLEAIPFGSAAATLASASAPGLVKPDGATLAVAADGTLSAVPTSQLSAGPGLARRDVLAVGSAATQGPVRYSANDFVAWSNATPFVRVFGGVGDGGVHTVATAPSDHPLAGVTTLAQLAAVAIGGSTPFAFVTAAPFTGSVWQLTDAKVPQLDLDWLAIQAALYRQGVTTLPRGTWVIGSALPLPLLIRESAGDDPSVYGMPTHLIGEGQTASVLKAGSDFGAGVPLVSCGDPAGTKSNGLGRYAAAGVYTSRLAHLGLLGPRAGSIVATGALPAAMSGLAFGRRLSVEFCQITAFAKGLDIVGDGKGAVLRCISALRNGYGAYWNDPSAYAAGDLTFHSCSWTSSTIAALGVHGNATILGATFSGQTSLSGPYGVFGETGGSGATLMSAVTADRLVASGIGNGLIHDENGFVAGVYGTGARRDCRNVQIRSVFSAWDDTVFFGGGGRGRVAWVDCRTLENLQIDHLIPDAARYSPTQGPSGPAPVAWFRLRTVGGACGGARVAGDVLALCADLAANAARFVNDDVTGESGFSFAQTGLYAGRLFRYARPTSDGSALYELIDAQGDGGCVSGGGPAGAPVAGVGIMAGIANGGVLPAVTQARHIPIRGSKAQGSGALAKNPATTGTAQLAGFGSAPTFGRYLGYDSTNQWITASIGPDVGAPAATPTAGTPVARPVSPLTYLGVNVAGLSFGSVHPGVAGTDYFVPSTGTIDYWASRGATCIRLCFSWERVQPTLLGALDPAYLGFLTTYAGYAATKGVSVILDLHNYGRYGGTLIGTAPVTPGALADVWTRLATAFGSSSNVLFGLMNEPETSDVAGWLAAVNTTIAAIRATGATQPILAAPANGGNLDWLGLAGFEQYPGFTDPLGNTAIEVHKYFDSDSSGTNPVAPGFEYRPLVNLASVAGWCRRRGLKFLIGETGFSTGPSDLLAMDTLLGFAQKNSDVCLGVTFWGAGPGWADSYVYHMEQLGGVDQPQVAILQRYAAGGAEYGVARPRGGPRLTEATPTFGLANSPQYVKAIAGGHAYTDEQVFLGKREIAVSGTFSLSSATPVGSDTVQSIVGYLLGVCVFVDSSGNIGFGYQQYDIPSKTNSAFQASSTVKVTDGLEHRFLAWAGVGGAGLMVDGTTVLKNAKCWNPDWKSCGIFCHYTGDRLMNPTALGRDIVVWTDLNAALTARAQSRSFQPFLANVAGVVLHVPCDGDMRTYF